MAPFASSHLDNVEDVDSDSYDLDWNSDQPNLRGQRNSRANVFRPANKGKWDKKYQEYQSEPAPQCDSNSSPILQKNLPLSNSQVTMPLQLSDGRYRLVVKLPRSQGELKRLAGSQNMDLHIKWNNRLITLVRNKGYYQGLFDAAAYLNSNFAWRSIQNQKIGVLAFLGSPQLVQKYQTVDIKIYPVCTTLLIDSNSCNLVRNGNFQIGAVQKNTKCIPYWQTQGKVSLEYGKKYNQKLPAEQKVVVLKKDGKIRQDFIPPPIIFINTNPTDPDLVIVVGQDPVQPVQQKNYIVAKIKYTTVPGPQKPIMAVLLNGQKIGQLNSSTIAASKPNDEYVVRYQRSQDAVGEQIYTLELVAGSGTIVIEQVQVNPQYESNGNVNQWLGICGYGIPLGPP